MNESEAWKYIAEKYHTVPKNNLHLSIYTEGICSAITTLCIIKLIDKKTEKNMRKTFGIYTDLNDFWPCGYFKIAFDEDAFGIRGDFCMYLSYIAKENEDGKSL